MDLNDIGVRYNMKQTNIQSIIDDIEQVLRERVNKVLGSSGVEIERNPKIQINHSKTLSTLSLCLMFWH